MPEDSDDETVTRFRKCAQLSNKQSKKVDTAHTLSNLETSSVNASSMVGVIEALVRRVAVSKSSTVTNAVEPSAQEREKAAAAAR